MTFKVGKTEILIQDTIERKVGEEASVIIKPEDIHIMHKGYTMNVYDGVITKDNKVSFAEGEFACDVTKLYPGSKLNEDGYWVTTDGQVLDLTDVAVKVEVPLDKIEIIDNEEDGDSVGETISIIYKGDHYQFIIRTFEE